MSLQNPRIQIKKDRTRSVKVGDVSIRPKALPIAVARSEQKLGRAFRVHATRLGIKPIDAWHPFSQAVSVK